MRRLLSFAFWVLAAALPATALSQSYPSKPIRVIVPYPAGNTADISARLIGMKLAERFGQQIIVDNRPGASGQLGMDLAARAAPDGYTIAVGQGGNMVVAPHTYKKIPYDPVKDFAPVALIATNFLVLVTQPNSPFKNAGDMVRYAKANPGKLTVAANGEGGFPHLIFEDLRMMTGFTYLLVPYKGSAQIATEVMGGQVQIAVDGITGMAPYIRGGKLRLLGVTSPKRVSLFPDSPAVAESVPGYSSGGWFGFVAPAHTPKAIIDKLNKAINEAMAMPDVHQKLTVAGLIPANESPEFFGELIKSDLVKYGKLVRGIGFQPR
jgi:tripartite-type tricarboxylate transporter receptor subunit TctC